MEVDEYAGILYCKSSSYYILRPIGQGAASVVYLGLDMQSAHIAIKLYTDNTSFQNEIQSIKIVTHKNVIGLLDYGEGFITRGRSSESVELSTRFQSGVTFKYALLEYASNGELFDYVFLTKKGFGESIARRLFTSILNAVEACHNSGVIHGDLKTENILLTDDFQVKLSDFGLSRVIADGRIFDFRGTKGYSSPDIYQAASRGYDGVQNEIFSLGVVLFVITTGRRPFENATFSDNFFKFIAKGEYSTYWKKIAIHWLSDDFKDLMNKIFEFSPTERITLSGIKSHKWFIGPGEMKNVEENVNVESKNGTEEIEIEVEIEKEDEYIKEFLERKGVVDCIKQIK